MNHNDTRTCNALLDDWFGPQSQRNVNDQQRQTLWFSPSNEQDLQIQQKWKDLHLCATRHELTHWHYSPASRLGLILLLDQFPRVLYRSTPKAFAWDGHAAALSLAGIDVKQDQELALNERVFFYMPLQHSEDIAVQKISLRKNQQLVDAFPEHQESTQQYYQFAQLHHDIIEQFGRFPHRNKILGRTPTPPEQDWLESEHGQHFGQA